MRTYTRARFAGGCYFFTVNLAQRRDNDLLVARAADLRQAFRVTRAAHPFTVDAIVVLPEHLHCIWTLPEGDSDFSTRWRLIKAHFSRAIAPGEDISISRRRKSERGIWQRRFWEHLIREENDYARHMDYIHFNPVKHGYVATTQEWPLWSFDSMVRRGFYPKDWSAPPGIADLDFD